MKLYKKKKCNLSKIKEKRNVNKNFLTLTVAFFLNSLYFEIEFMNM